MYARFSRMLNELLKSASSHQNTAHQNTAQQANQKMFNSLFRVVSFRKKFG